MNELVEVKTAELSGAALDWAVAMAEGYRPDPEQQAGDGQTVISPAGVFTSVSVRGAADGFGYRPSAGWAQGGPLIDKYMVDITTECQRLFYASVCDDSGMPVMPGDVNGAFGPTHLIAACRAIVSSVLGETVNVPKELCHE